MNAAANTLEKNMQSPPTTTQAGIANPSIQKEGADSSGDKMKVRRRFSLHRFISEKRLTVHTFLDARPSFGRAR